MISQFIEQSTRQIWHTKVQDLQSQSTKASMSQQKPLSIQIDGHKLCMLKSTSQHPVSRFELSKKGVKYTRSIGQYSDLPSEAQNIFKSLIQFEQACDLLFSDKNKKSLWIDQNGCLLIKFPVSIMGKITTQYLVRIQMFQEPKVSSEILERILKLEHGLSKLMGQNMSTVPKPQDPEPEKQPKKKLKENKQTEKQKIPESVLFNKAFRVQERKVVISLDDQYRIQACLVTKAHSMAISVSIYVYSTNLTYTGELSDLQINQFLSGPTKMKNSKQLFQEIKKNARKQTKDTLKVNERQNKLQILIILLDPKAGTSSQEKQESIFAEIDIKPVKEQANDSKTAASKINDAQSGEKRSISPANKDNIIQKVRTSVLEDKLMSRKPERCKPVEKPQKSPSKVSKVNQNYDSQRELSQVSFRTKKTVAPSKSKSKDKFKNLLDVTLNESSIIGEPDNSCDLSLNLSYSKRNAKSSKGFLLNKQHGSFTIQEKAITLRFNGLSCALLARKVPKKNVNFEFMVRIKKISEALIIGVASQEVGLENSYLHQYLMGYSPIGGMSYENGILKETRAFNQVKSLKENSVVKVRINLKNQLVNWYLKEEDINKQNWKLIKEMLIPHYMQSRDLYPIVFMKNAGDKVEFLLAK